MTCSWDFNCLIVLLPGIRKVFSQIIHAYNILTVNNIITVCSQKSCLPILKCFFGIINFCRLISRRNATRYLNTVPMAVEKDSQRERYVVLISMCVCVCVCVRACVRACVLRVCVCVREEVSSYLYITCHPSHVLRHDLPVIHRGLVLIFIP